MEHQIIAGVSIAGTFLDVFGTLYLAYDLLGGEHGPLRLLTRAVTYSIVFGMGYALGLRLFFGMAAGITTGVSVAIELHRAARHGDHYSFWWEAFFSALRGCGVGLGLYPLVGARFAVAFAALITAGQVIAYRRGMRPGLGYSAERRPRINRKQFWGTVVRTIGYSAAAIACSYFVQHLAHPWWFAIRVGLVTGIVTGVGATINPFIEYYADHLPERTLGVVGIVLILCGFVLQSMQYWIALLNVPVT